MATKQSWAAVSAEAFTEDAVRASHQPAEHYKTYVNAYDAGHTLTIKASHDFTLYLLDGSASLTVADAPVMLSASEFIHLPGGAYECACGAAGAKLLKVFSRK